MTSSPDELRYPVSPRGSTHPTAHKISRSELQESIGTLLAEAALCRREPGTDVWRASGGLPSARSEENTTLLPSILMSQIRSADQSNLFLRSAPSV
jgi:hypothetical protein